MLLSVVFGMAFRSSHMLTGCVPSRTFSFCLLAQSISRTIPDPIGRADAPDWVRELNKARMKQPTSAHVLGFLQAKETTPGTGALVCMPQPRGSINRPTLLPQCQLQDGRTPAFTFLTAVEVENRNGVGSEILEWAEVDKPSLLVIGSHGRGALGRMLMGSVSYFVASNAPCPVLVARTEAVCRTLVSPPSSAATTSAMSAMLLGASPWSRAPVAAAAARGGAGGGTPRARVIAIAVDLSEEESGVRPSCVRYRSAPEMHFSPDCRLVTAAISLRFPHR